MEDEWKNKEEGEEQDVLKEAEVDGGSLFDEPVE